MKKFFSNIMKITPHTIVGIDYSGIVFLYFIAERINNKIYDRNCPIFEFTKYIYRFYSDVEEIRNQHYDKMIQNTYHFSPFDFLDYCKTYLKNLEEIGLLKLSYDTFEIQYPFNSEQDFESNLDLFNSLVSTMSIKYSGANITSYSSIIGENEYADKKIFYQGERVFNRVLEKRNYCFICNNYDIENLVVVRLTDGETNQFDANNYILLCHKHANLFLTDELEIKKNGYAYINKQRQLSHLPIEELKLIRNNLK